METELAKILSKLDKIEELTLMSAKTVLSMDEAVLFTSISKDRLYRLTSEHKIPFYKPTARRSIYFKKSELESWLLQNKVLTLDEINSKASTYVATH